jgi:hypothetical protein
MGIGGILQAASGLFCLARRFHEIFGLIVL